MMMAMCFGSRRIKLLVKFRFLAIQPAES